MTIVTAQLVEYALEKMNEPTSKLEQALHWPLVGGFVADHVCQYTYVGFSSKSNQALQ